MERKSYCLFLGSDGLRIDKELVMKVVKHNQVLELVSDEGGKDRDSVI